MDLGGIALVLLIFVLGLGLVAGTLAWMMGRKNEQQPADREQVWPEEYVDGDELPPREDAWKPAIWYSEAAKGTLFPNQPSPSFRISADTSFHRAISLRDLEAGAAADGSTVPDLPAARDPVTTPGLAQQESETRIPDEVENLADIPTQTLRALPVKDDLPPTLKLRSVARNRITYPLPEAAMEVVTSAMAEKAPDPEPVPPDSGVEAEAFVDAPDPEAYPAPNAPTSVDQVVTSKLIDPSSSSSIGMEELDTSEMVALEKPALVEDVDTSEFPALEIPVVEEPVDAAEMADLDTPAWIEQVDTSQLVAPPPPPVAPMEDVDVVPAEVAPPPPLPVEELESFQPEPEEEPQPPSTFETGQSEPEPDEPGDPLETSEERYERLIVEAYSQVIHVVYDRDLDAVALSFSGCPIRQNSDVPWVFKTISRKIQDILAPQAWHQHALLVDVARLQVAPEAQAAWEMMLDGFVAQSCPEVTSNAVLAIQYDSSAPPDEMPDQAEASHELQMASSITGQQRPLIQASSDEAAIILLRLLRTEV